MIRYNNMQKFGNPTCFGIFRTFSAVPKEVFNKEKYNYTFSMA